MPGGEVCLRAACSRLPLWFSYSSYGVRWVYGMALPVGDRPLYFRFSGDHVLGSDPLDNSGRRLGMVMTLSLGIGTGLGLGL